VAELKPKGRELALITVVVARLRQTIDRYDSHIAAMQNAFAIYFSLPIPIGIASGMDRYHSPASGIGPVGASQQEQ
jgi:hypothetical protein